MTSQQARPEMERQRLDLAFLPCPGHWQQWHQWPILALNCFLSFVFLAAPGIGRALS